MTHTFVVAWPYYDIDFEYVVKEVKGDTIYFDVIVDGLDLDGYKIRASITDGSSEIRLANTASGGSDDEIVDTVGESGTSQFRVIVPAGDTENFADYGCAEIEIEDTTGHVFTIIKQNMSFKSETITWSIPS